MPVQVDVWLIALEDASVQLGVLSKDELGRARRFLRDEDRRRWQAARAALRVVLSGYLERPPRSLAFAVGPNGKPSLSGPHADELHFNLSHSGGYALLGVSRECPLGIDIERHRDLGDAMALARRFFARDEVERLQGMAPAVRALAFFECWSRKEAVLKATGAGIGDNLATVSVAFGPCEPVRVLRHEGSPTAAEDWTLANVRVPAGYSAAIAVPRPRIEFDSLHFSEDASRAASRLPRV